MATRQHTLRPARDTGWRCTCRLQFATDAEAEQHAHVTAGRIEIGARS